MPKIDKIWPKCRNFAKSSHTVKEAPKGTKKDEKLIITFLYQVTFSALAPAEEAYSPRAEPAPRGPTASDRLSGSRPVTSSLVLQVKPPAPPNHPIVCFLIQIQLVHECKNTYRREREQIRCYNQKEVGLKW